METRLWALAESLLPERGIGRYIQAQMDLGATLCTRARPACARCPFHDDCVARREGRVAELPAARPKKVVPRRGARCAVILHQGAVLLERRPPAGIWGGLLALPELPAEAEDAQAWSAQRFGLATAAPQPLAPLTHAFTHFVLELQPLLLHTHSIHGLADDGALCWLPLGAHAEAALPTPVRRILDELARPGLFDAGTAAPRSI